MTTTTKQQFAVLAKDMGAHAPMTEGIDMASDEYVRLVEAGWVIVGRFERGGVYEKTEAVTLIDDLKLTVDTRICAICSRDKVDLSDASIRGEVTREQVAREQNAIDRRCLAGHRDLVDLIPVTRQFITRAD